MDPTTADFNAWLAEEGAKVGATVMPQPSNLLAMYGQGYAPADSYDQTTADVLSRMHGGTAIGNLLRSLAPEVRQADDSTAASGILSRLSRTGTGLVHSGLNTAANWLEKRPEIGPDTLAPLGLAPMGALVGHSASLAKPSIADSARARYLEWKHPEEMSAFPDQLRFSREGGHLQGQESVVHASHPTKPYDADHTIANERGTPRDRFRLLSDQSRASVPGTLINAMDLEKAKPVSSDAAKPTYRDHALAQGKDDLYSQSPLNDIVEWMTTAGKNQSVDDFKKRMAAALDYLAGKSPSGMVHADNARASVPGTVVNAQEDEDKKKRKK